MRRPDESKLASALLHEFPVLLVAAPEHRRAEGQPHDQISAELVFLDHRVVESQTPASGRALACSAESFGAVVLDWGTSGSESNSHARGVLDAVRRRSELLPVFLLLDHADAAQLSFEVLATVNEVVDILEDAPALIAGRVDHALRLYLDSMSPPCFDARDQLLGQLHALRASPPQRGDQQPALGLVGRDPAPQRPLGLGGIAA